MTVVAPDVESFTPVAGAAPRAGRATGADAASSIIVACMVVATAIFCPLGGSEAEGKKKKKRKILLILAPSVVMESCDSY